MDSPGSVTRALRLLRDDDPRLRDEASRLLCERYFGRLLGLARGQLDRRVRRREDEEDVVQSVFASFYRRKRRGEFGDLCGRSALWALLATITDRKARNAANRHRRAGRDYRREQGESALAGGGTAHDGPAQIFDRLAAAGLTPADAAALDEEVDLRLRTLPEELRRIAERCLEGYTNREIAAELGRTERSVERKLARIRAKLVPGR